MGPTASVLDTKTMPISERVLHKRAQRARRLFGLRIAGDDGGPPKPLLEETIGEILEAWLDSPVEFADNECERVRLTDLRRQCLHLRGRFAQRLFLVHAIHDRQADSPGVDEFGRVTT